MTEKGEAQRNIFVQPHQYQGLSREPVIYPDAARGRRDGNAEADARHQYQRGGQAGRQINEIGARMLPMPPNPAENRAMMFHTNFVSRPYLRDDVSLRPRLAKKPSNAKTTTNPAAEAKMAMRMRSGIGAI